MATRRKPLAVKKSAADCHEEAMRSEIWQLWHALQDLAETPNKKVPPTSISKYRSFEWSDGTKEMGLQGTMLAMIHRLLIKRGFRRSLFDSSDLNHQYVNSKKGLCASIGATRLGVMVHVQGQ